MNLTYKQQWFGNIRADILSGIVVALALIPEAIAFSIIAGVDPKVGLYASFCIACVIAFFGGRPAMISAATGAMAIVMVTLVKDHGLQYLFATTILTGLIQILIGLVRLGSIIKYVSKSVMNGFVNALAILIFMAQLPEFVGAGLNVYVICLVGLAIIYLFPYLTKAVPSPLVAIVFLSVIVIMFKIDVRVVGDMGSFPNDLPSFFMPNIPLNLETLYIIFPYAVTLAFVGLIESLMTSVIVDDFTDSKSSKNQECVGQGLANIVSGFFGGMAGCAMIGQSVINVKSGGRGRLSTFVAGSFLLILILFLSDYVKQIPMAALVAVMIMVSISTFSWESVINLRKYPIQSNIVMLSTVAVVLYTHNLAEGVFVGVLLSAMFFAKQVSKYSYVESKLDDKKQIRNYQIIGQVFFASAQKFNNFFDFDEDIKNVKIDLTQAHFWDLSAVNAFDKVVLKFKKQGINVEVKGLNKASETIIDRLGANNDVELDLVVKK